MSNIDWFVNGNIRNKEFIRNFIYRANLTIAVLAMIWLIFDIVYKNYEYAISSVISILTCFIIHYFLDKDRIRVAGLLLFVLSSLNILISAFLWENSLIILVSTLFPLLLVSTLLAGKKGMNISVLTGSIIIILSWVYDSYILQPENKELVNSNYFFTLSLFYFMAILTNLTWDNIDKSLRRISENQLNYKILMDESPDSISILDNEGFVLDVNSTFEDFTGIKRQDIIGTDGSKFLEISNLDVITNHFIETRDTGSAFTRSYLTKDGKTYYFELVGKLLPDNRILHQLRDVTDKIQAEEKYKQAEEVLINSQKFELVGRLAGQVAHDFNNILTAILNYAEITLMDIEDGTIDKSTIEQIRNITYRGTSIAKSLLSTTSQKIPDFNPLNINQEINERKDMLKSILGPTIELEILLDENIPNIVGDVTHFEQILLNVILNGKDAVETNGKITITTKMEMIRPHPTEIMIQNGSTSPLSRYVCLSISDTGSGMSKKIMEQIFEAFYTKKGRGTGLGLYIVHSIMDLCNGHISVHSEEGKGTTFNFYFPPTEALVERRNDQVISPPKWLKTVLIVEDQDEVRESMARSFKKYNIEVKVAENGARAKEIIMQNNISYDLVVTDLVMPEVRGDEFLIWFRKKNSYSKAILMSAYDFQLPLLKIHFAGDSKTEVMTKPFVISEVFQLLNEDN